LADSEIDTGPQEGDFDTDELPDSDSDSDSDADSPREKKSGGGRARNLPTWNETVGVIVQSNMESRKKSPSRRRRGGRRNRRDES
jgi:hypothetical protein